MQLGFFDEDNRLEKLSKLGDNLERLNKIVNWEIFRPILSKALTKEAKGIGGRPAYDYILMFKILILQRMYNLSDDQTEFQINDRFTFMRFLGLHTEDRVPDAKTIWLFRENLSKAEVANLLFKRFNEELLKCNIITREGSIVDATFIEAPRQRNTKDENASIKSGNIPEEWKTENNKSKLRQKDVDAKWTQKGGVNFYGYKNHVKADADSKLITEYSVTSANVHDSVELTKLVNDEDKTLYADSAYFGKEIFENLPKNVEIRIHEKGYRNHPLTDEQKANNREKSKIRSRIEHIFGFMTMSFHGLTVRSIGLLRAKFNIGITNLLYNICRIETISRKGFSPVMG